MTSPPAVPESADSPTRARVEVVVGKVGRAHGLSGDVFVEVRTDEPDRRFAVGTTFPTAHGPLTIQDARWHSRRLLLTFAEVPDRTAAEAMRGVELTMEVPADERPADPEEYYDHQLVGLHAVTPTGAPIGDVTEVLHLPAQDLLSVRTSGGQEVLIPFVREVVPVIELATSRITISDSAGLLPSADDEDADRNGTGPRA